MSTPRTKPSNDALIAAVDRAHRDLATVTVAFQEIVARRLGMTAAERKCLGVLGEIGTATPGQLAEATGLTTGAITGIVDRLARAGFVERLPNPADGRSRLIHLRRADELAALTGPVFGKLGTAIRTMAATYDEKELRTIERYLGDTMRVLREQMEQLKSEERAARLTADGKDPR
jgi:predicted ArsR family transcriptional regulator